MQKINKRTLKNVLRVPNFLKAAIQGREKPFIQVFNVLTTVSRFGSYLFLLAMVFVVIVSLLSGTANRITPTLSLAFSPDHPQRKLLTIAYVASIVVVVFSTFSIGVEIIRWFLRDWIAHFAQGAEEYLLTWKKLLEIKRRRAIIRVSWDIVQVIWVGLILAVAVPLATELLKGPTPTATTDIIILSVARWIFRPTLSAQLILWSIVTFIVLSFILRQLAHNVPKEESLVSVKELGLVHNSLDKVSEELGQLQEQRLQQLSQRILAYADKQFVDDLLEQIKELTDKTVEPLGQRIEKEEDDRHTLEDQVKQLLQKLEDQEKSRQNLEKQVQQILQNTHASSVPAAPTTQSQTGLPPDPVK
jgi:hypothetical protein